MNVHDLSERYDMKVSAVRSAVTGNLEQINETGEHAKTVNRRWEVDDEGVRILDSILGFAAPEPEPKPVAAPQNPMPAIDMAKIQCLHDENDKLNEVVQDLTQENRKLHSDYDSLQGQFLALQEGRESMNASLVRKYQSAADKLKNENTLLRKRVESMRQSKETQYKEQKDRIDELTGQLEGQQDLIQERLKLNYELSEAQKNVNRLSAEITDYKHTVDKLKSQVEALEIDRAAGEKQLADTRQQVAQAMQTMDSVKAQLSASIATEGDLDAVITDEVQVVKEKSTKQEAVPEPQNTTANVPLAESVAAPQPAAPAPQAPPQKAASAPKEAPAAGVTAQEVYREELKENIRQDAAGEKKKSGWQRVASFFGFM